MIEVGKLERSGRSGNALQSIETWRTVGELKINQGRGKFVDSAAGNSELNIFNSSSGGVVNVKEPQEFITTDFSESVERSGHYKYMC